MSVAEQVLALVELGGVKNPSLDWRNAGRFNKAYLTWRAVTAWKRIFGKRYQESGPCHRGHAAPEVES